jgi:hypothetical protein
MTRAMIRLHATAWKDPLDCLRASDLGGNKLPFPQLPGTRPPLLRGHRGQR